MTGWSQFAAGQSRFVAGQKNYKSSSKSGARVDRRLGPRTKVNAMSKEDISKKFKVARHFKKRYGMRADKVICRCRFSLKKINPKNQEHSEEVGRCGGGRIWRNNSCLGRVGT